MLRKPSSWAIDPSAASRTAEPPTQEPPNRRPRAEPPNRRTAELPKRLPPIDGGHDQSDKCRLRCRSQLVGRTGRQPVRDGDAAKLRRAQSMQLSAQDLLAFGVHVEGIEDGGGGDAGVDRRG